MFLRILALLLLFTLSSLADNCDKSSVYESLNNLRIEVQNAKQNENGRALNLYKSMERLIDSEHTFNELAKICPEKTNNDFKSLISLSYGITVGIPENVDSALALIDDEKLLEKFIGVICAIDCESLITSFNFITPKSSLRIMRSFTNILERTNINNTEINTSLKLIGSMNKAKEMIEDDIVSKALQNLFRDTIKTDLILQHDNIEKLYDIDMNLTKEIIYELVSIYSTFIIENHSDLALYPLFDIIKCKSNIDIWADNLNTVFEVLSKNNNLHTLRGLLLLHEVNQLLAFHRDNEVLQKIKSELPPALQIILNGQACANTDETNKTTKLFLVKTSQYKMYKFVPNPEGSNTLITGPAGGFNFTIILYEPDKDLNKLYEFYAVDREVGNLEEIRDDFCKSVNEISVHACLPLLYALPTPQNMPVQFGIFHKLVHYYKPYITKCKE